MLELKLVAFKEGKYRLIDHYEIRRWNLEERMKIRGIADANEVDKISVSIYEDQYLTKKYTGYWSSVINRKMKKKKEI